ncbi:uncharacterized protein LOC121745109 [Salvia splendens]|uniref:uncharacterized protein LOC121745109 n=1 Tax=Salvia splendens TaxID=180675 RepID=UPI001C2627FA|nr:uncharacterized protein LOC121745109 [Salvia splendens]
MICGGETIKTEGLYRPFLCTWSLLGFWQRCILILWLFANKFWWFMGVQQGCGLLAALCRLPRLKKAYIAPWQPSVRAGECRGYCHLSSLIWHPLGPPLKGAEAGYRGCPSSRSRPLGLSEILGPRRPSDEDQHSC